MSRPRSKHNIDRAAIRALLQVGSYLLPEDALREQIDITVVPAPTRSEIDDSLRWLDTMQLIISGDVATGRGWKITAEGRVWASENRITIQ